MLSGPAPARTRLRWRQREAIKLPVASRVVAARRRDMPGIATLGKLFFNFFLEGFGPADYVPSRQENNPAEIVATVQRIRRAPPAQNRRGGDSERVRPDLRTRV